MFKANVLIKIIISSLFILLFLNNISANDKLKASENLQSLPSHNLSSAILNVVSNSSASIDKSYALTTSIINNDITNSISGIVPVLASIITIFKTLDSVINIGTSRSIR